MRKEDFFPDKSFESLRAYRNALAQTPQRLKDRLGARADAGDEILQIRPRSKNEMKRTLNWWDLAWFAMGAVIGAGIFVLTGQEAHSVAGPAIILSYVGAGFSALLSVFCYTEFAVEIPVAGGSFSYLRVELGDFVAFIAAGNIILEALIGAAALARSWTSYFATLFNHHPDDFRILTRLPHNFNLLDPIAVAILIVTGLVAIISTRSASLLNWIASSMNVLIILFVIIAGLTHANPSNLSPFMPFGAQGVFKATAVLFFSYLGFDTVCTLAEETKDPKRDIPIGLLGSMTITTILYCLMALTLCLMQKYNEIDVNAPFSSAFRYVAGWKWAQYVVALGALKGMTSVMLVGAVGQARYITHIARTHLIPPWFAYVNGKTGTPVNATASMVIASSAIAFFSSLEILANLLSISTLFIFNLVALSLLVRRYYMKDSQTSYEYLRYFMLFTSIIIASSIATAIYWASSSGWFGYVIALPLWFLSTLGLAIFVPQVRKPKFWGVPFVPWVPSLSIFFNIFLLASMDKNSYIRFGVWTGLMLVYYIFFGLHASFDAAKEMRNLNLTNIGDRKQDMNRSTEEVALLEIKRSSCVEDLVRISGNQASKSTEEVSLLKELPCTENIVEDLEDKYQEKTNDGVD